MGNYDAEVRVSTRVDTSQMQKLQSQINNAVNNVDMLTKQLDKLRGTKIPTDQYVALSSQIKETENRLERLQAKQKYLSDYGKEATPAFDKIKNCISGAESKLSAMKLEMQEMVASGNDFHLNTDEISKTTNELEKAKEELRGLLSKQEEIGKQNSAISNEFRGMSTGFSKLGSFGTKAFSGLNRHVRKSNSLLSGFVTKIKNIALSLLVFNWITKGFNAMVSGMKEGFKNLVQYSDEYNRSISSLQSANAQLKNSFAAAFAPIVQMIIPYLVQLIGYVTAAMNTFAQFIAILSGASTWTKATAVQKNYAASLKGTASAAKKAAGALASFDEIEVLSKKDNSGSTAGGADPSQMFDKVPVDPKFKEWLDSILNKLKPLLEYLKELGGIFMDGFWDGLGDYEYRIEGIKEGFAKIKDALRDIFTDPEVVASAKQYVESLVYLFGTIVGSIASIGLTIAMAFTQGLGDYLQNNKDRIKDYLINMFDIGTEINTLLASLFVSIAYIFEAFASESGIRFVESLIGVIVDTFMGMSEILLKLGRDILEIIVTPITENADGFKEALEGLLSSAAEQLSGLKEMIDSVFDNMNTVYDEHFKPFFDSIASGLSHLVGVFLEVWNTHISPMINEIGSRLGDFYSQHLAPLINAIVELIGNLVSRLQWFWENIIMPIVELIITYVFPIVADIFDVFITKVINGLEVLTDGFTALIEFLNQLMEQWGESWDSAKEVFNNFWEKVKTIANMVSELLSGVFATVKALVNGDWKLAWENAKKLFTTFKDDVKKVVDTIKDLLQKFFDWVSELIANVLGKLQEIGSAVTSIFSGGGSSSGGSSSGGGGASASFQSYQGYAAEIPHLATGAVIRGGNPFMAVLGDQKFGQTNIEAPLSTIEDAVRNAMSESGNAVAGGDLTVNINYDGETFARLFLSDFLSEAHRQGYDIEFNPT